MQQKTAGERNDLQLEIAEKRLLESAGQSDALEAIRDIVTNLLGSEEIALFQVKRKELTLTMFWSFGIESGQHNKLNALRSPVLKRVIAGEPYVEGAFGRERNGASIAGFSTFVPIRLESTIVAVLGIRRLLPQKTGFDESDMQLLQFLSLQAGRALFGDGSNLCTRQD